MPRKPSTPTSRAGVRTRGDEMYNARKRFTRQAERYMKKARSESGTLRGKYETLARIELNKALDTYASKPKSKGVTNLMRELGVTRDEFKAPDGNRGAYLVSASISSLESEMGSADTRRDKEARSLLNTNIGRRVYGGLVSIWQGKGDINDAITKHFGVDSMADVLDIISSQINLYSNPDALEKYDEVRSAIELAFA